ncbi:MAG: tetratricopeptide repeat protein [Myxococcota bacterium]
MLVAELDELLASVPKPRSKREAEKPKAAEPVLEAPEAPPKLRKDLDEPDLSEEIEEIEFYLQQGLEDEARDSLEALLVGHPGNAELIALKDKLDSAAASPPPEPEPAAAAQDPDIEPEPETLQMETVDIAAELAQELDAGSDEDFQVSLADVFDDFKRGVAEQVDESDFQTHYDLGIAYKEMGLLDDALREFTVAVTAAPGLIGARTMVGLLQLELGNTAGALDHFLKGLNSEKVTAGEALALRFEIGRAYEAMGRFGEAKKFYEKVHAMDATFRNVTNRLAEVELQSADALDVSDELDALLTETDAEKSIREPNADKISYI